VYSAFQTAWEDVTSADRAFLVFLRAHFRLLSLVGGGRLPV